MLNNYVPSKYVVTTVTLYHSALVDLSRSRSVHAVEHDPCCPDPTLLSASECKAVHHGLCSPLLKLPPFSIPPLSTSGPSSPSTPKSSQSNSKSSTPTKTCSSSPLAAPKVELEILDPVELLAADLEGKLEALVNTFVRQDKVRVAARKKAEGQATTNLAKVTALSPSAPLSPTPQPPPGLSTAPTHSVFAISAGRSERKVKDDRQASVEDNAKKATVPSPLPKEQETMGGCPRGGVTPVRKPEVGPSVPGKQFPEKRPSTKTAAVCKSAEETTQKPNVQELSKAAPSSVEKRGKQDAAEIKEKMVANLLKTSPEYQQTGVKAQINKFTSIEKETSQHSPLLERKASQTRVIETPTNVPVKQDIASVTPTAPAKPQVTPVPTNVVLPIRKDIIITSQTAKASTPLLVPSPSSQPSPIRITPQTSGASPPPPLVGPDAVLTGKHVVTPTPVPEAAKGTSSSKCVDINNVKARQDQKVQFRPSSYPSAAYKDVTITPIHTRSASHVALPAEGRHPLAPSEYFDGSSQLSTIKNAPPTRHDPDCVLSAVDYAKTRFQNVQQTPKMEEISKPRPKNGHLVSEAKFRWENVQSSLPGAAGHSLWPNHSPLGDQLVVDPDSGLVEPLRDILQRAGHRRTLSIDGMIDGQLSGPTPAIPHPKLTSAQRQHIRERSLSPTDRHHSHVPIRPFLTKGSVAERVLLFECCPDRALERAVAVSKPKPVVFNTWRTGGSDVHSKTQSIQNHRDKENIEPSPRSSSLRKVPKYSTSKPVHIPRFYFPQGRPPPAAEIENHLQKVAAVFAGFNDARVSREEFGIITKACGLPLYWKVPLFLAAGGDKKTFISCEAFLDFWRRVVTTCHDEASRFIRVLTRGKRNHILPEDFVPMIQDVIETHPGLTFLKEAIEFHSRYVHTVIARIYYCVNRSWSGKITAQELRKSNFLQVLSMLEEEEDINQITEYFSYEHFYVIYCKFWELDKDHDLFIDKTDLRRHNDGAMSSRIIDRIFSGAVTRGPVQKEGKMSYTEFVWFLISEEDKRHPRSIEYWFRCMDLDGDGFLSMFELEYFYEEQLQRMEALGIETLPFKDCLCQMLDMVKPTYPEKISLSDLKKCRMTPIFFDTFFNLEKYLDHEQRDPFASQRQEHDGEGPDMSDWDRYAAEEYELLVAEEGASDHPDEMMYEDYEQEEDELSPNLDKLTQRSMHVMRSQDVDDDEYDYAESDADYHY